MSFSLHSSSSNLGSSKRCERNWSARFPVKSSTGEMSLSVSPSPLSRNQSNDSFWTEMRLGGGRTSASFAKERRSRRALDDKRTSCEPDRRGEDSWPGGEASPYASPS